MWIENERLSEKSAETHLTRSLLHSREAERRSALFEKYLNALIRPLLRYVRRSK